MKPILVLNAGSSSLKFSLLDDETDRLQGLVEPIGKAGSQPRAQVRDASGQQVLDEVVAGQTHGDVLGLLVGRLQERNIQLAAVGHRIVHGGDRFTAPVRVTAEVLAQLEALTSLAPLHQPHNLQPIRYFLAHRADLPQVACFDTAFHATQDPLERRFALPRSYFDQGVKRYGFHGLSYEYIASRLAEVDPRASSGKTIVCHLGNGASLCALRAGRSAATTMSFTPLDGLVMGTRCGTIDPGVLLHLWQHDHLTPEQLAHLLYHESGLLGVSGQSSDMRDLLTSNRPEAAEAVELFCYRIAREIGALSAVLGGLDAIVFTAGIGEHAAPVRERVCRRAAWLGVELDAAANAAHREVISTPASRVIVRVIPTNEERMIARHTARVLASPP
jgi:acetate kinase